MPPQRQSLLLSQNFDNSSSILPHFFQGTGKNSGSLNFDINFLQDAVESPLMVKKKNIENTSGKSNVYDTLKVLNASETSKPDAQLPKLIK